MGKGYHFWGHLEIPLIWGCVIHSKPYFPFGVSRSSKECLFAAFRAARTGHQLPGHHPGIEKDAEKEHGV